MRGPALMNDNSLPNIEEFEKKKKRKKVYCIVSLSQTEDFIIINTSSSSLSTVPLIQRGRLNVMLLKRRQPGSDCVWWATQGIATCRRAGKEGGGRVNAHGRVTRN